MQLGLSSYTYTWAVGVPGSLPDKPITAFNLIDRAFMAGLKLVQIADNLPLEDMTDDDLITVREYAMKRDVKIETGSRGLTAEHAMKCILTAEKLHSPILRMVIDSPGFEPDLDTAVGIISGLIP